MRPIGPVARALLRPAAVRGVSGYGANQCAHGALARSCSLCEKDARIAELEATVEEWKLGRDTLQREFAEMARKLEGDRDRYRDAARMLREALADMVNQHGTGDESALSANEDADDALSDTAWLNEGTDGK